LKQAIYVPNFGDWGNLDLLAELATTAEKAGYDGIFLWDHINITGIDGLDTTDPTVALAVIAKETSSLRFGPIITPLARRRPWKLARELVSLDHLSGGRLVFGTGLGEPGNLEFSVFGEDSSGKIRAKKVDEGLQILDSLVRGGLTSFSGDFYQVEKVRFRPSSFQQPRFPIWIAATLPYKSGITRSLNWDGVFPVVMPKQEPMVWSNWFPSIVDFKLVVEQVRLNSSGKEAFDFIASGQLGETRTKGTSFSEYGEAGATWWFHWVDEKPGTYKATMKKISSGLFR